MHYLSQIGDVLVIYIVNAFFLVFGIAWIVYPGVLFHMSPLCILRGHIMLFCACKWSAKAQIPFSPTHMNLNMSRICPLELFGNTNELKSK